MNMKTIIPILGVLLLIPSLALGQGFQSENFQPKPSQQNNILNVAGSDVLPHMTPSFDLTLHVADTSVQTVHANTGEVQAEIVESRFKSDLALSLGLYDRMQVGVTLPVALYQTGDLQGSSTSLSDLRLSSQFELVPYDENLANIGFALRGDLSLPTGNRSTYNSDGMTTGTATAVLQWQHNGWKLLGNAGYNFAPDRGSLNFLRDDGIQYGVAAEAPVSEHAGLFVSLFGRENLSKQVLGAESSSDSPAEALVGVRGYPTESIVFQVGGGTGMSPGVGTPDARGFVSLSFKPSKEKEDPTPPTTDEYEPEEPEEPKEPEEPEEEEPDTKVVTLDQMVHFDTDKAKLKPEGKRELDEVASVLKDNPQLTKIRIEGHTDSRASHEYNRRLSIRRAIAVETYLMENGVDEGRLKLVGYGETEPIAPNDHPQKGMAQNRRAEFRVLEVNGEKLEDATMTVIIQSETNNTDKEEK